MSGPTVFLNVLQASAVQAKRQHDQMSRGHPKYTVLLIITDGIMATFDETLRKLRVYQQVPLSIIFVGVGRSDFADLNNLCQACPENTTFVEFRQQQTPSAFAHAALSQLPRQMSNYMTNRFGRWDLVYRKQNEVSSLCWDFPLLVSFYHLSNFKNNF